MLGVARRNEDEPAHRDVAGVPDGMRSAPRDKDEAAGADLELTVTELERRLSVGDIERLVGVRVQVKRRPGLPGRERPDLDDV